MKKILKPILLLYIPSYLVIYFLNLYGIINNNFVSASIYAGLLALVNFVFASMLFFISVNKSNGIFLIINLGGMGARIFFLLISIILLLKLLKIDIYGFILIFFLFYFILLFVEVNYFRVSLKAKKTKID